MKLFDKLKNKYDEILGYDPILETIYNAIANNNQLIEGKSIMITLSPKINIEILNEKLIMNGMSGLYEIRKSKNGNELYVDMKLLRSKIQNVI